MVKRLSRLDRIIFKALRLGIGIGIKRRHGHRTPSGPETTTAHLMRVGFDGDKTPYVGRAWVGRGGPAGEAGDSQVERSPEKMDRTHLAEEPGSKLCQHAVCLQQNF